MEEKQLLKKQKENLNEDIAKFKNNIIERIKHIDYKHDKFKNLYVFSNFYSLATDKNEKLNAKYAKFSEDEKSRNNEIAKLNEQLLKNQEEILSKHSGIEFDTKLTWKAYNLRDDDNLYTHSIIIDGKEVFSITDINPNYANKMRLLELYFDSVRNLRARDRLDIDNYNKIASQIKELKDNPNIKNKIKLITLNKELKEASAPYITKYNELMSCNDKLSGLYNDLSKTPINGKTLKNIENEISEINKNSEKCAEQIKKELDSASYDVLALEYAKIYHRNFDTLRMEKDGASDALRRLIGNTEYYTDAVINRVASKMNNISITYKIASALHDNYRESFKNADGTYTPRWKTVSDKDFIKDNINRTDLPNTLRINSENNTLEIDITNSNFNDLSFDWQMENFAAAKVAKQVADKGYTKADAGIVGHIIHDDNWLVRNEERAKGTDLDVPFSELVFSEKVKDLVQYEVAGRVTSKQNAENISKKIL